MERSDRLLVAVAFLTFVVVGLNAGVMGVAWPSMRDAHGVGDDAYGTLALITTLAALVVAANSGRLIAWVGTGRLLTVSCLVGAVGFVGIALAPSWPAVVALGLFGAFGTASITPSLNTYFAMHQGAGRLNWLNACFGLGATVSPTILTAILKAGGSWRWGYGMVAIAYVLLAVGYSLTANRWPQPDPAEAGEVADPASKRRSRRTLALPAVWFSLLLFFTFTGMEASSAQWAYTLFTEGRGISPTIAGAWVSVFWAAMTVGRIVFGIVVDRLDASTLVRVCMSGAVLGAVAIWVGTPPWLGFLGLALAGLCLAPLFPVLTAKTPQRLGAGHAADAIGYQMAAVRLGLAAYPALAGVLVERVGVASVGPYLLAVAVLMLLLNEATERVAVA